MQCLYIRMAQISKGRCFACQGWMAEAFSLPAEHMVLIIKDSSLSSPGSHQATEGKIHSVPEPYYNVTLYSNHQLCI